jgi:hypothetical protein
MKTRILSSLFLVVLLVSLSGCPNPAISKGVWLFTVDTDQFVGVEIGFGGMAQTPDPLPPEAETNFNGALSWVLNGSTFTLTQVSGGLIGEYTGTLDTSTSIINGTWMQTAGGSASGTWFAEKL